MDVMELRRRLPRAEREEQLLTVAQAMFAERGFRAPSMEEIAVRAGVTKPVLYDHFGSKDGLVAACIRRAGAQLLDEVASAVAGQSEPVSILRAGFTAFFGFIESRGQGWFMLIGENSVVGPAAEALESIRSQQAQYVAHRLAAVLPPALADDIPGYAEAIIGACERVALWRRDRPGLSAQQAAEILMSLMWNGLAGQTGPSRLPDQIRAQRSDRRPPS